MGPNVDAYTARGATKTTALLAHILGLQAADINDGTAVGADRGKITTGGVTYDPANAGQLKTLADLRSIAVNPRSANGRTAYGVVLTPAEQALFAQAGLANNALATHAAAVLLEVVRTEKGGALDDALTGGGA